MEAFLRRIESIWRPHDGQRDFLLNSSDVKVLACGLRWGKTDACAVQVLYGLTLDAPTEHLILAPTADQAAILFERALTLLDGYCELESITTKTKVKRSPYPHLRFGPHSVMARSGHVPRSLRGHQATHIVVDEAAYLPESLITEVAMPMLATTEGRMTMISTPHGKNHFWRFFQMGQEGEHGVWSRQAPSDESPYVSDSFLKVQRELISDRAFQIEYEAEFLDSTGRVFKTESIDQCLVPRFKEAAEGPFCIGIDWARYGDYTAAAVLSGHREDAQLVELVRFQGISWTEAVSRMSELLHKYADARVICDATGVGDPVLELLRKSAPSRPIEGLVFTSQTKSDLIDGLAWMFEQASLKMEPNPDLLRELEHFEAEVTGAGNVRLAASGSGHDDLVTALALASRLLPRSYRPKIVLGPTRTFSSPESKEENRC